ncbi:hypothetical protein LCGC14_0205570 [marine sediment metagenome]|uniref:Inosine/uridine-preferring nucleoside hydrolase domain-containing protein n=1 Tax=marine sediment metagenome TaxID=412755 RepID=A0A0F9XKL0_9ZZZZ
MKKIHLNQLSLKIRSVKKLSNFLIVFLVVLVFQNTIAQSIPYTKGRILISSDGNEHDHDDWAATPMSLALLASKGLQDSLVLYAFSDHIWGSNIEKGNGREEMQKSALRGKTIYNFKNSRFIEAVAQSDIAVIGITEEINKSSKNNGLYIIAAGPMHVVGSAIAKADMKKLQFVRLISHSNWNNNHADKPYEWEKHSGWTIKEIKEQFESKGLKIDQIVDQNGGKDYEGLKAPKELYDWIKTSNIRQQSIKIKKQLDWLYERQLTCVKKGDFDPSDAGMIVYLLTGKEKTHPDDVKKIIENQEVN